MHQSLNKKVDILQTIFLMHFLEINVLNFQQISLKHVSKDPIDLFHNNFSLADSSPNTVNYLMSYDNQLPVV